MVYYDREFAHYSIDVRVFGHDDFRLMKRSAPSSRDDIVYVRTFGAHTRI